MSGRPSSSAATSAEGGADPQLCREALRVIRAERAIREKRRREASPSQSGYLVAQLMEAPPGSSALAQPMAELVELGPRGLEELVARFPGPLWTDPRAERRALPPASEIGPLPMALLCFGPRVHPVITGLLESADPQDRLCAAAIAPAFASEEVMGAVTRLTLHGDPDARRMALRALRAASSQPGYSAALSELRRVWGDPRQRSATRMRALHALAQLGDATLVPELVQLLGSSSPQLVDGAHEALCVLTAHDFGPQRLLWRFWLSRRGHLPRHQWLLSGLRSRRERLRDYALKALSRLLDRPLDADELSDRRACVALADSLERELVTASGQPTDLR